MKIDVSEIKAFKGCRRQWELSSRNRFHLRPKVTPVSFALGTIFHEALAQAYLGVSQDKVMEMVRKEMSTDSDAALLAMVPGYYKNVLPGDLDRFVVLDIEHHFEIAPRDPDGGYLFGEKHATDPKTGELLYDANGDPIMESLVTVCGSIDMIVLDPEESKIYGFEHKTCKSFRDPSYLWMDEQPRVYTWALQQYVETYNDRKKCEWQAYLDYCLKNHQGVDWSEEPETVTLGGVYLNEVKKLLRQFQYQRTLCTYEQEDLDRFMESFFQDCFACKNAVDSDSYAAPKPSYFGCNMCQFNTICTTYMYKKLNKSEVLDEFSEEFTERTEDHLEEKVERSAST